MSLTDTNNGWVKLRKAVLAPNTPAKTTRKLQSNSIIIQVQSIQTSERVADETNTLDQQEQFGNRALSTRAEDISYLSGLYVLIIIVGSLVASSVITCIPWHDSIRYPQYWYEFIIQVNLAVTPFF